MIQLSPPASRRALWLAPILLMAFTAMLTTWLLRPDAPVQQPQFTTSGDAPGARSGIERTMDTPATAAQPTPPAAPTPPPTGQPMPVEPTAKAQPDPNDLATYIRPGDVEPTGAELIQALREAGETEGIAAFNPPGTSPPLPGLAVPEDYVLPPGYVRHHQVTDAGEPIEAILMFAPDHVILDAQGQVIPLPADRVVPPELAPPGLPIRQVDIPPP